jgi:predicted DNA binding CopG/RHH family protein
MSNRFKQTIEEKNEETTTASSQAAQEAEKAAKGRDGGDTRRLNVRVPEPLYDAFKAKVDGEGRTMTWVILQAMRDYLND